MPITPAPGAPFMLIPDSAAPCFPMRTAPLPPLAHAPLSVLRCSHAHSTQHNPLARWCPASRAPTCKRPPTAPPCHRFSPSSPLPQTKRQQPTHAGPSRASERPHCNTSRHHAIASSRQPTRERPSPSSAPPHLHVELPPLAWYSPPQRPPICPCPHCWSRARPSRPPLPLVDRSRCMLPPAAHYMQ